MLARFCWPTGEAPMPEPFQAAKFKELLLYLAQRSAGDPLFGATKLNKLLFYCDFLAYGQLGRSVTGARYQRLKHGPAPRQLVPIQRELEAEGAMSVQVRQFFNQVQKRPVAMRPPNLGLFSGEEIALVDMLLEVLRHYSASEVSALSHLEAGWQLVDDGEDIPYESVFLSPPGLTEDDVDQGLKLWHEHGGFAAEA